MQLARSDRSLRSRRGFLRTAAGAAFLAGSGGAVFAQTSRPVEAGPPVGPLDLKGGTERWTDEETKRTVRRITPPALNAVGLYHHQRAFTSDGRWMVFRARGPAGFDVYCYDLRKDRFHRLTEGGRGQLAGTVPGRNEALVTHSGAYYLVAIPDGILRKVADVPGDITFATAPDLTCDGRFMIGVHIEITDKERAQIDRSDRYWVIKLWKMHLKNRLFTLDLHSGRINEFYWLNSWVDHLQCSPVDPTLFTYVDQGVMQRTGNSVHVMRTDGSGRQRVAEGGGHHIWSPDGDFIFHNDEWLNSAPWSHWRWDSRTGTREEVLPCSEWNFHFCSKPGGRELVGDGMWSDGFINHYRLLEKDKWSKTRLCKRVTKELRTEDQARFAPDYRSVFFNGNVEGISAIFQVEAES